ncbi:hypothetical protein BaRGS_00015078 [Batillaria attramentaria]|uniref:Uncharacterized protein n=1 Tax=Batillaria attramentaria TaxID=370345 RepID=A0ABD0L3N5_9CAEN
MERAATSAVREDSSVAICGQIRARRRFEAFPRELETSGPLVRESGRFMADPEPCTQSICCCTERFMRSLYPRVAPALPENKRTVPLGGGPEDLPLRRQRPQSDEQAEGGEPRAVRVYGECHSKLINVTNTREVRIKLTVTFERNREAASQPSY